MLRFYISFSLALLVGSAVAQKADTAGPLYSLTAAATRHLPLLLQKQAQVNSAKAGVTIARNSFLPSAVAMDEVTMASANSLPGAYESFGVIPSVSSSVRGAQDWQAATGNFAVLYSQYELANFGLRKARIDNARSLVGISQADMDFQTYLVQDQVAKLYFELMKAEFQLSADRQNISRYVAVDTIIQSLTSSGIRPGVDSSLAQAEISKARVTYNQRLGDIAQLTQQLAYLTGVEARAIAVDTTSRQMALFDQGASGVNPLLTYYQQQKAYNLSSETLVKKSYLPKLILAGGAWGRGSSIAPDDNTYKDPTTGLGYQRFNYMIGLTLAYNLFDPIHRRNALSQARYQTQASDYALQQQELNLNSETAQAQAAIDEAESNLREIPIQIRAATDAYNQKIAQYKAGLINLVDLTEATYVLYTAQVTYAETLNNWYLANLDKATATGNLNQFIQSIK